MSTDYPEHLLAREPPPPYDGEGPFWRRVANSTVGFSGSRLRNSAPHPDRFG